MPATPFLRHRGMRSLALRGLVISQQRCCRLQQAAAAARFAALKERVCCGSAQGRPWATAATLAGRSSGARWLRAACCITCAQTLQRR